MTDKKVLSDEEEEEEDSEPVVIVTKRKSSIKIVSDAGGEPQDQAPVAAPAQAAGPPGGIYQQLTVETPPEEAAGLAKASPQQLSPKLPAALQQPQQRASPTPVTPVSSPIRGVSPAQQQRPAAPVQQQQAPRPVAPQQVSPRPAAPQQVSPRPVAPQQVSPRPAAPQQVQQQPARPVPQQQQPQQAQAQAQAQAPFVATHGLAAKTPPWSPQGSQPSPTTTGFNDQAHPVLRQVPMKPAAPLVMPEQIVLHPLQQSAHGPATKVKVQDDFGWRQGQEEAGMGKPERQSSRLGSVWPPPPSDLGKDHGPPVNKIKTQEEASWVQQESVSNAHAAAAAPWVRKDVAKIGAQWPPPEAEVLKENLPVERTLRPQWPPPSEEVAPSSQVYQKIALQQVHSQVAKQKQYFGSGGQIKPDEGYESETAVTAQQSYQQQPQVQQKQQIQQQQQQQRGGPAPGGRPGVPAKPGVAQKPAAVFQNGPAAGRFR